MRVPLDTMSNMTPELLESLEAFKEIEEIVFTPRVLHAEEVVEVEAKAVPEPVSPLVALFQARGIRILGTADSPLFCASDVAKHIGDMHSRRIFLRDTPEVYIRWEVLLDALGHRQRVRCLTESGLYRYLFKSPCPLAEPFQNYVYALLTAERKRTVDSIQLALKISQTKLEDTQRALKTTQTQLTTKRWEMDSREFEHQDAIKVAVRTAIREERSKARYHSTTISDETPQSRYFWPK